MSYVYLTPNYGVKILSYPDNTLYVLSYTEPGGGVLTRDDVKDMIEALQKWLEKTEDEDGKSD